MSGVRVQNIDPQCPEKLVWQYFTDLCGPAAIDDVYYPLLNNNAVVIFKDTSAMAKMLTSRHEKWVVLPLPNQVFSKHRVWLEGDLTALVHSQEQYQEVLRNNAGVDLSMDKPSRQITLTGQSYQIEWAWRYLSNLQDQQQHSSGYFRSLAMGSAASPQQLNGVGLPNGDLSPPQPLHGSAPPGHRPPHNPTVHNSSMAPISEVTSTNSMSGATRRPSPGSDPPGPSPRGQDRGQGGRRTKPPTPSDVTSLAIEGLGDEPQTSLSTAGAGARLMPQEKPPPSLNGAVPKSRVSPPGDDDPGALMAAGGSETRVPAKTLTSQAGGHISAEDNVSAYVSLPAARISREHARSPAKGAGRHSQRLKPTDLDNAEVIYRAPSYLHSVSCPPPQDDHDDDRGPQSLTPWGQGQGGDPNYEDVDFNGACGGPRAFSSLPYNNSSSSLRLPANSKLALLNRSVVELSRKHFDVGHRLKLKIYMDDITKTRTDAVVNAANWELKNIGGVAGALAKAAGPEMEAACRRIYEENGALRTAQVVKTKAYGRLSHLKYVFHTVGPIYRKEDPDKCVFELAQAFLNCLMMADKLNLESITFPFISAGIFGMPIELCVVSLFTALLKYSYERHSNLSTLEEVHFINNDMDVVCNAVLSAEAAAKQETMDTSVKRMVEGEKLYGRGVHPFCDQSAPAPRKKDTSDARYAMWDSSADQGATATSQDSRGRQLTKQHAVPSQPAGEPQSATPTTGKTTSGARARSRSFDRGSKTATVDSSDTQTSSPASGRDPSPMPKPRSRSNSFSGARRDSSSRSGGGGAGSSSSGGGAGSSSQGGGATSAGPGAPRVQPQIKQSIIPTAAAGTSKKRSMGLAKSVGRGRTSDQSSNDTDLSSAAGSETEDADKTCPICLDDMMQPKTLSCGHRFCAPCVDKAMAVSPRCPKCQRVFGIATGTQPRNGTMGHTVEYLRDLPGYPNCGMITITYDFPAGRQESCHPNPGRHYDSTHRVAYLPNNSEGQDVLKMLQKAFDRRLVFTIGDSVTTGAKGVITWNDIHHKTSTYGGPSQFGYPDPDYLFRVKEELAAKGITHP